MKHVNPDLAPALPMFPKPKHANGPSDFSPYQQADRTRQLVALRAASPLMGKAGQHDASGLALFRQADEPPLL